MKMIDMYQQSWRQLPPEARTKWDSQLDAIVPPTLLLDLVGSQFELQGYVPQRLADHILCDSMLTARILKAANSAEASPIEPITSVRQALVMLGFFSVRQITITYLLDQMYSDAADNNPEYVEFLQKWLCGASIIAFHWTKAAKLKDADTLSTAAMLCRVGSLVMAQSSKLSEQYVNSQDELWREQYEMEKYSVAAPLLSAEQVRRWGIPESLVTLIFRQRLPLEHDLKVGSEESQQTILSASLPLSETLLHDSNAPFQSCLEQPSYYILAKNLRANGLEVSLAKVWDNSQFQAEMALTRSC